MYPSRMAQNCSQFLTFIYNVSCIRGAVSGIMESFISKKERFRGLGDPGTGFPKGEAGGWLGYRESATPHRSADGKFVAGY